MANDHVNPTLAAALNQFVPESRLWEVTYRYKLATIAVTIPALNRAHAVSNATNMLSSIVPRILIPQGAEIYTDVRGAEVSE